MALNIFFLTANIRNSQGGGNEMTGDVRVAQRKATLRAGVHTFKNHEVGWIIFGNY